MIVITFNSCGWFLKTYVIKSSKRCTIYIFYRVIRYKKMLFPTHEYKICICKGIVIKCICIECFSILVKWFKLALKRKQNLMLWNLTHRCDSKQLHTQCFLSTSSSASHFRVRNGYFLLIISPSKKVVNFGNSSVRPLICR